MCRLARLDRKDSAVALFEPLCTQRLAVGFSFLLGIVHKGFGEVVTVLDRDLVVRAVLDGRHVHAPIY